MLRAVLVPPSKTGRKRQFCPVFCSQASTRLRSTQTVKTNHYVLGESFAHYLCARDRVSNHIRTDLQAVETAIFVVGQPLTPSSPGGSL